jgi:hypothetical protein
VDKYIPNTIDKEFYIYEDNIHTEIIIKTKYFKKLSQNFPNLLKYNQDGYIAFSFGDKDFFMEVETWQDIKIGIALKSLFLNTPALIRVSHFKNINKEVCIKVNISDKNLNSLKNSIFDTFKTKNNNFIRYNDHYNKAYTNYYLSNESYNLFYTCNSWTGERLKDANLPQPFITPFTQQVIYPF